MTLGATDVLVLDTTLRDGSHAMSHRFTEQQVRDTVRVLDLAGVPLIEVAHGEGLAGSSFNFGFTMVDELQLIRAAAEEASAARIAVIMNPGLATRDDLRAAVDSGAQVARIATHCTEADISPQHIGLARDLGLQAVGFLMMSHTNDPQGLAGQARIMADAGAECVYVVDSAGAMMPADVAARVQALVAELGDDAGVGFHGHQNLSLGIANSLAAFDSGARWIDGSTAGLGAGAGNTPTEIIAAVFDRMGVRTGLDLAAVLAAAEEIVTPYMRRRPVMDRGSILLGYTGVCSSFLLHAQVAADRYAVPLQELLAETARRRYVAGQEDMLIDVAVALAGDERRAR